MPSKETPRKTASPARKIASRKTAAPGTASKAQARSGGAPTRPARGRRSPEELQARILGAAVEEFAEHGYSGARVERISKAARTVDRMLYYYFGSKDRLYQAALEHVFAKMIEEQRGFVMVDDPVRGMRELIEHSWNHYRRHPELVRLLASENLLRARWLKKSGKIRQVSMPLVETVEALVNTGKKKKLFRADADPERVLMTIMALGFFYVSNQYSCSLWLDTDLMADSRCEQWLAHITDVILRSLLR